MKASEPLCFNNRGLPVRHLGFKKETADHLLVQSAQEVFPPLVLRLGSCWYPQLKGYHPWRPRGSQSTPHFGAKVYIKK